MFILSDHVMLENPTACIEPRVHLPNEGYKPAKQPTKGSMPWIEEEPLSHLSSHSGGPVPEVSLQIQNEITLEEAREAIRRLNSPEYALGQLKEHYRVALFCEFTELVEKKAPKRQIHLLRQQFAKSGIHFGPHGFVDAVFRHGLIHYEKDLVFQIYGVPSRTNLPGLITKMKGQGRGRSDLRHFQLHKFDYLDGLFQDVAQVYDGEPPVNPGVESLFPQVFTHHLELLVLILNDY